MHATKLGWTKKVGKFTVRLIHIQFIAPDDIGGQNLCCPNKSISLFLAACFTLLAF